MGASRQDSVQDKNSPRKQPSALPAKPTEIGTMEKGKRKNKNSKEIYFTRAHTKCLPYAGAEKMLSWLVFFVADAVLRGGVLVFLLAVEAATIAEKLMM